MLTSRPLIITAAAAASLTATLIFYRGKESREVEVSSPGFSSLVPSYLGAVIAMLTKPRSLPEDITSLPELRCSVVEPVAINLAHLEKFRRMCRCRAGSHSPLTELGGMHGGSLPPTYLNALVFRLQLQLMTHPKFPVNPVGSVHARNSIVQARTLRADESFTFRATLLPELRTTHKGGVEFDIRVEAYAAPGVDAVWTNVATFALPRARRRASATLPTQNSSSSASTGAASTNTQVIDTINVPASAPREYSSLNGDINPIHLHPLLARAFGFRTVISHGMHTAAWAVDALIRDFATEEMGTGELSIETSFLRPMFLQRKFLASVQARTLSTTTAALAELTSRSRTQAALAVHILRATSYLFPSRRRDLVILGVVLE
eukprot:CAMPEP_0114238540 /NCGR_PEP_ID=MMETSP0058-20121206/7978_1 /TAXON_ID=36894 /ORGANISM="Pyramimonas parkeae, CCMP726" /LENGTH=376 /DNA_ID=CAMNT_0001350655 /DNA_START=417 /DNA_END=1548 /DNA_ORIENTATION=+